MARRVSRLGLSAVGIWRSVKIVKQIMYNGFLPKVSESGANINGPRPSRTTKEVVAPMTAVDSTSSSFAMAGMAGVNAELVSGLRMAMKEMMPTLASFRHLGQFRGCSSSSSSNLTT